MANYMEIQLIIPPPPIPPTNMVPIQICSFCNSAQVPICILFLPSTIRYPLHTLDQQVPFHYFGPQGNLLLPWTPMYPLHKIYHQVLVPLAYLRLLCTLSLIWIFKYALHIFDHQEVLAYLGPKGTLCLPWTTIYPLHTLDHQVLFPYFGPLNYQDHQVLFPHFGPLNLKLD